MSLLTLNDRIDNPLLILIGSVRREISRHRLINLYERGLTISGPELMLVANLVSSSSQFSRRLIVLVQERYMAVAVAIAWIVISLKASQDRRPFPMNGEKVRRPDTVVSITRPDEVAIVSENVRSSLARSMLFEGGILKSCERSNE